MDFAEYPNEVRGASSATRQICTNLFKGYKAKTKWYQNRGKRLNDENKRLTIRENPLTEAVSADIILLRECVLPSRMYELIRKELPGFG